MACLNFISSYIKGVFVLATAIQGKKVIYKYRVLGATTAAFLVGFTTENSRTVSVDADITATKDGGIRTAGVPEIEITCESILQKDDTAIKAIEDAMLAGTAFEIWEINLEQAGTGQNKYKGKYYQGYCTELEKTSNAEDFCEISLTFGIDGIGADGDCTVTSAEIEAATYTFKDTVATT